MFIDGLDEIDGQYDSVIRTIKRSSGPDKCEICLSSRPLPVFEEAFNASLGLGLHDLTYHSIRAYANVQLFDLIQERVLHDKQNEHRAKDILDKIVERANEVFL